MEYYPKTASTAFAYGDAVTILPTAAGAGTLAKVTSSSPYILGTILKKVTSTDSDYASTTMVPVLIPGEDSEFLCLCSTTSAATTDQGEFVDANDELSLNVGSYTYGVAQVTSVLSSTSVIAKFTKKSGPSITTA